LKRATNLADRAEPSTEVTFEQLIRDNSAAVYRVARAIVRDHSLAEDVTQDTLIKAWRALPRFRGESSLRTWVLRIASNTAISMLRRRREELRSPWSLPVLSNEDLAATVERSMAMEQFGDSLADLDPSWRAIVVLREVEGMAYEDIAAVLNLSVPTVRTRLFRARRALADSLEGWR
jgi:RNA polymerase sigma-70 factor (ECF subfamily)